jgi:hypothetical protein
MPEVVVVNGAIVPFDLLVLILSFLCPYDASWVRNVCAWWRSILLQDHKLRAQIERNYVLQRIVTDGRLTILRGPQYAAWKGYNRHLLHYYEHCVTRCSGSLEYCVRAGHLHTLTLLLDIALVPSALPITNLCVTAAKHGHLPILREFHRRKLIHGPHNNHHFMREALRRADLPMIQWIHTHLYSYIPDKEIVLALHHRRDAVIAWLLHVGRLTGHSLEILSQRHGRTAFFNIPRSGDYLLDLPPTQYTTPRLTTILGQN